MIKIKVIDLLNKIANGEIDYIHRIIYNNRLYEETTNTEEMNMFKSYYHREENGIEYTTLGKIFDINNLNDEVKIKEEEDKKIRKLDFIEENTFSKRQNGMTSEDRRLLDSNFRELGNKINEIIDYIYKE